MIICECTQKIRDRNKIIGYKLRDDLGAEIKIDSETLKKYIKSGQIQVINLTLTSNNRLVDKAKEVPLSKVVKWVDAMGTYIENNTKEDLKLKYVSLMDDDTDDVAALTGLREFWVTDKICIDLCTDIMAYQIEFYINIIDSKGLSSKQEYNLEKKINNKIKKKVNINMNTPKEEILNIVKSNVKQIILDIREMLKA